MLKRDDACFPVNTQEGCRCCGASPSASSDVACGPCAAWRTAPSAGASVTRPSQHAAYPRSSCWRMSAGSGGVSGGAYGAGRLSGGIEGGTVNPAAEPCSGPVAAAAADQAPPSAYMVCEGSTPRRNKQLMQHRRGRGQSKEIRGHRFRSASGLQNVYRESSSVGCIKMCRLGNARQSARLIYLDLGLTRC